MNPIKKIEWKISSELFVIFLVFWLFFGWNRSHAEQLSVFARWSCSFFKEQCLENLPQDWDECLWTNEMRSNYIEPKIIQIYLRTSENEVRNPTPTRTTHTAHWKLFFGWFRWHFQPKSVVFPLFRGLAGDLSVPRWSACPTTATTTPTHQDRKKSRA